jgi:hypothetical protein
VIYDWPHDIGLLIAGAVLGGAVTIILSRSKLAAKIVPPVPAIHATHGQFTALHVDIENPSRWWTLLAPALRCKATISFYSLNGHNLFGTEIVARWVHSPQPAPVGIIQQGSSQFAVYDLDAYNRESRKDIYPAESEPIDTVIRFDTDDDCYVWSNESYTNPHGARDPNRKLQRGVYLVRVKVSVSGMTRVFRFRLHNDGLQAAFRLEIPSKAEAKLIPNN